MFVKKLKKLLPIIIILSFVLALLLMVRWFLFGCLDYSKSEYSLLQTQEFDSRTNLVTHTEFHSVNGYDLVVFVPEGKNRNMWIMLNPKYSPYFKQMPPGEFSINRDVYGEIEKSGFADTAVLVELKSRIVNIGKNKSD